MTGNDIVDIATAAVESNWKRKGFIEKQFTKQEQFYVQLAQSPDAMLWRIWSMKESAYKIYTRQYGGRFFAPLKFSCTIINDTNGIVDINNKTYQTTCVITKDYVYSVAKTVESNENLLADKCFHIADKYLNKKEFLYKKIIDCFAKSTAADKNSLAIIKNETGVPSLLCKNNNTRIPVSITHHGSYAAFTIN